MQNHNYSLQKVEYCCRFAFLTGGYSKDTKGEEVDA